VRKEPQSYPVDGQVRLVSLYILYKIGKYLFLNIEDLPSENTLINMLNRMRYNLKRVLKSKPAKKIKIP